MQSGGGNPEMHKDLLGAGLAWLRLDVDTLCSPVDSVVTDARFLSWCGDDRRYPWSQ